jgi:hypothetical protein
MRTLKTRDGRTYKALTPDEVAHVKGFMQELARQIRPDRDGGTCVLGNQIEVLMVDKGKRTPRYQCVFLQRWSQGEQWRALHEMINVAKARFPLFADAFHYNCGRMD